MYVQRHFPVCGLRTVATRKEGREEGEGACSSGLSPFGFVFRSALLCFVVFCVCVCVFLCLFASALQGCCPNCFLCLWFPPPSCVSLQQAHCVLGAESERTLCFPFFCCGNSGARWPLYPVSEVYSHPFLFCRASQVGSAVLVRFHCLLVCCYVCGLRPLCLKALGPFLSVPPPHTHTCLLAAVARRKPCSQLRSPPHPLAGLISRPLPAPCPFLVEGLGRVRGKGIWAPPEQLFLRAPLLRATPSLPRVHTPHPSQFIVL
eukprot:RCo042148